MICDLYPCDLILAFVGRRQDLGLNWKQDNASAVQNTTVPGLPPALTNPTTPGLLAMQEHSPDPPLRFVAQKRRSEK